MVWVERVPIIAQVKGGGRGSKKVEKFMMSGFFSFFFFSS